jgi:hypothetical protein
MLNLQPCTYSSLAVEAVQQIIAGLDVERAMLVEVRDAMIAGLSPEHAARVFAAANAPQTPAPHPEDAVPEQEPAPAPAPAPAAPTPGAAPSGQGSVHWTVGARTVKPKPKSKPAAAGPSRPRPGTVRDKILTTLVGAAAPMSVADLVPYVRPDADVRGRHNIRNELRRMEQLGEVEKLGPGLFRAAVRNVPARTAAA